MPRNMQTHVYVTLGFRRDLAAWKDLQAEAQQRDMSIPRLIKLILVDRQNSAHAHEQALSPQRVAKTSTENGSREMSERPRVAHLGREAQGQQDNDNKHDPQMLTHKAAAAAAFWGEE